MEERLQKIMAQAGIGSRRHNEELIRAGKVRVNGKVAQLGDKASPLHDKIEIDGKPLPRQEKIYIILHKPRHVLSSTEDELEEGRRTVRDMVDIPGHLYPVGRLDKESMGLILLTNDGALAHQLTHPRYEHPKTYRVLVEGHPSNELLRQWRQGVMLDGEMTAPAQIKVDQEKEDCTWLEIVLREGRKRQIRRLAAELGHPVRTLVRTKIGPLSLGDLPLGKWRHLSPEEVSLLRYATRRQQKSLEMKAQYQEKRKRGHSVTRRQLSHSSRSID